MEETFTILDSIKQSFDCKAKDPKAYSPLALAYIGDDVYDLVIRTVVVERANRPANELHKMTVKYVNAGTQAQMAEAMLAQEGMLTEEEIDVYHRGRNAKSYTSAKNASIQDYRKATGFEALIGYLYLSGRQGRVVSLIRQGIELIGKSI